MTGSYSIGDYLIHSKNRYPGRASLVFNCRKEYYNNNVFAVNHIMLDILYETVFFWFPSRSSGTP
jgi:hypothetical protein